jgi:transposase
MRPFQRVGGFQSATACRSNGRGCRLGLHDFGECDCRVFAKTSMTSRSHITAWTDITRPKYQRNGLRYTSDTADAEWAVIEPHLPPPARSGRTRTTKLRDVVDAFFCIARSGCQWRLLSKNFPPYTAVRRYFYAWRDNRPWQNINHGLLMDAREAAGREAGPTAGVIDSQSVKTTESGGPRGFDAGKKVKGRKRHILTDTISLPVGMDVQDRDGVPGLLASVCNEFRWLRHVFADGGYAGDQLKAAIEDLGEWTIQIVKRSDIAKSFVLLPRRWVVERWLNRNRRLAKDVEATIESVTWLCTASVKLTSLRLAAA